MLVISLVLGNNLSYPLLDEFASRREGAVIVKTPAIGYNGKA